MDKQEQVLDALTQSVAKTLNSQTAMTWSTSYLYDANQFQITARTSLADGTGFSATVAFPLSRLSPDVPASHTLKEASANLLEMFKKRVETREA